MPRFAARDRFGQQVTRLGRQLGWKLLDRFHRFIQLETEILQRLSQHQGSVLATRIVNQLGFAASCIAANELNRDLSSFDRCARNS